MRLLLSCLFALLLNACASPQLRGTGDLGLVIERSSGNVTLVNTTSRQPYARIGGLGDLSHASAVYSRDGRYAFVFGRDGGLTKIDLLEAKIVKRIIQQTGRDPALYSGHSLRAGFVTEGVMSGVSEHLLMMTTAHRSAQTLQKYVRVGKRRRIPSLL